MKLTAIKSKYGYSCKSDKMIICTGKMKGRRGTSIVIQGPSVFKVFNYECSSELGAVEQLMRDSFNNVDRLDVLKAMHAKIMEDLGLKYDERFF